MAAVTDTLLSELKGGALTNKFEISITPPMMLMATNFLNKLTGGQTKNPNKNQIRVLAKSTSIPTKSISTVDVWHRGMKYPIRGKANFDNSWDITFYNDRDLALRGFFEEWMLQIDNYDSLLLTTPFTNNYLGFNKFVNLGYMTNMSVFQLCGQGKRIAEYEITHAFPKSITGHQYTSEAGSVSDFTVTFSYDTWIRKYTNGIF